jgi:putative redox protein
VDVRVIAFQLFSLVKRKVDVKIFEEVVPVMEKVWTEVVADWQGNQGFVGSNSDGGAIQINEMNGKPGVKPMELLLLGLAGCTGIDIVDILSKKRKHFEKFEVRVRGTRSQEYPKVYKEIEVIYRLWGQDVPARDLEQAIRLSEEKYCSAHAMLEAVAEIRSSYEILPLEDAIFRK